jgi:16S rRNA processing protein RimM
VKLGVVARAHGLRGELRIDADPTMHDAIRQGSCLRLATSAASGEFRVQQVRRAQGRLVLRLEGIDDRSVAEAWAGADVFVPRDALTANSDTYYDFELVGLEARSTSGASLGTVTEVIATGANDVIVIASGRGELLVPAIPGAVLEIDAGAGRVVVDERMAVHSDGERAP